MSIITAWLSDLKLGYCTQGWWLNRKFCCWEMGEAMNEAGGCEDWQTWTSFVGIQWLFYVAFAVSHLFLSLSSSGAKEADERGRGAQGLFAFVCAFIVKSFAPYAAGSGISEIKCILAGFIIKGFLSFSTLAIKSIALVNSPFYLLCVGSLLPCSTAHRHRIGIERRQGGTVSSCRVCDRSLRRKPIQAI
jgi:chloride channel 3/4/5